MPRTAAWLDAMERWLRGPVGKPLPRHVADLKLDPRALALHMAGATNKSDRVHTGYVKPKEKP